MKRWFVPALALSLLLMAGSAMAEDLKVGDKAPAFKFVDASGKEYTLEDFKDADGVVVAWFPKAFTPG